MRRVKLNDLKPFMFPERWDEVTLGQLMAIEECDNSNPIEVFGAISGVPIDVLDNSNNLSDAIYELVEFIYESTPDWEKLKHPTHLVIDGKPYKVPDPAKATLGQNIMLDQATGKPMTEMIPHVLAIYFQPLIDGGKTDHKRFEAVQKMVMSAPAIEAYATAGFFLRDGKNLKRIGRHGYIRLRPTPSESSQTTEALSSTGASSGLTPSSGSIPPTPTMPSLS